MVGVISLSLTLWLACGDANQQKQEPPRRLKGKSIIEMWNAHKVPAATFAALLDSLPDAPLIDVRTRQEYANGHIPGSINVDIRSKDFEERIRAAASADRPVLLYCQKGIRSGRAANLMSDMGYPEIYDLEGGFATWKSREVAPEATPSTTPTVSE